MATEDVHVKVCQQEIVKLDLQIKALIQVTYAELCCFNFSTLLNKFKMKAVMLMSDFCN